MNRTSVSDPKNWNAEYKRQGIPSSSREDPSGVIKWCLINYHFLSNQLIKSVADMGCGTGRNAAYIHNHTGANTIGLDYSSAAISLASTRHSKPGLEFKRADLTESLPIADHSINLITDVFVYFHILDDQQRQNYRKELARCLASGGVLLVSMATTNDGFYSGCPELPLGQSLTIKLDPFAKVGNILPTPEQLLEEFTDFFTPAMMWRKEKPGMMHGKKYQRSTTALLMTAK
jgi:ubiquinone/menaquinone biosynthesis C-methylase UbiE